MKAVIYVIVLTFGVFAHAAKPADPCVIQKIKLQEAELTAANISNINTTSTEEGGPYKRKLLKCSGGDCSVVAENKVVRKYMPEHPDADVNGYVKFPKIDLAAEIKNLNAATAAYYSAKARCE
jgi:flagellar basal-body rod protein FlgC